jgi:hypothetical protein
MTFSLAPLFIQPLIAAEVLSCTIECIWSINELVVRGSSELL